MSDRLAAFRRLIALPPACGDDLRVGYRFTAAMPVDCRAEILADLEGRYDALGLVEHRDISRAHQVSNRRKLTPKFQPQPKPWARPNAVMKDHGSLSSEPQTRAIGADDRRAQMQFEQRRRSA
jgi:hypothetical protein